MLIPKLAIRNIFGAGLRTWLNVLALSLSFVVIIFVQGIYLGLNDQVERATTDALYGGGQFWENSYDPFDPLSLTDAHAVIPADLQSMIRNGQATPLLIRQATIYPEGRLRMILLKGIDPEQKVLSIPSGLLAEGSADDAIPALIGSRMARSAGLQKGDVITVQWRDIHGTFDARDLKIVEVMNTPVQDVDNDQMWVPLDSLQTLMAAPGQATVIVLAKHQPHPRGDAGWVFKTPDDLLQPIHALVRSKTAGASILYVILLFLALLAIFDTQVLSIFRRKKEMGTLMALGMTRTALIGLFTLEGALHAVFAGLAAAVYGIPLLTYIARTGWSLPQSYDTLGFAIGEKLFPTYSAALIVGTIVLVLLTTTIVSYLPTRSIARLKPTDALRGKLT